MKSTPRYHPGRSSALATTTETCVTGQAELPLLPTPAPTPSFSDAHTTVTTGNWDAVPVRTYHYTHIKLRARLTGAQTL